MATGTLYMLEKRKMQSQFSGKEENRNWFTGFFFPSQIDRYVFRHS